MNIALHFGTLRGFGSSQLGWNLFREFKKHSEHRFHVWVPEEWEEKYGTVEVQSTDRVQVIQTRPGLVQKFKTENLDIPRVIQQESIEALFSFGDTSSLVSKVPHVLLIQQAHLTTRFKDYNYPISLKNWCRYALMKSYLKAGLKKVSQVTVQSNTMKVNFLQSHPEFENRISVIPSTVSNIPARERREKSANPSPKLSYVASGAPHKNHRLLLQIMANLKAKYPGIQCILTLNSHDLPQLYESAKKLEVLDNIDFRGPASHEAALKIMEESDIVLVPSKLESFGMPYFEAMALGIPLIASNIPIARESCGEEAYYADPDKPEAWAGIIESVLDAEENAVMRPSQNSLHYQNVIRSWQDIAQDYLHLLENLGESRK